MIHLIAFLTCSFFLHFWHSIFISYAISHLFLFVLNQMKNQEHGWDSMNFWFPLQNVKNWVVVTLVFTRKRHTNWKSTFFDLPEKWGYMVNHHPRIRHIQRDREHRISLLREEVAGCHKLVETQKHQFLTDFLRLSVQRHENERPSELRTWGAPGYLQVFPPSTKFLWGGFEKVLEVSLVEQTAHLSENLPRSSA